jgi:quercetin dioxygenase-like cupin family protein
MTQQTEPTLDALAVRKDEGEALWWFTALSVIKASGADTGGQMTIVEQTEPPNTEGPLHVHHREDEAFFILEGSATFQVGDQTIEAGAGDYLFGPRHVPHKYDTGPDGCRMLFICTPGGNFENIPRQMGVPAQSRTLPPPSDEEPEWERVAAIAKANGCELLA